jgi:type IV secretion system protein VirD4
MANELDHRPDQQIYDYKTQRKARQATHDAITGAVFGGLIGNIIGGTTGAAILGHTAANFMPTYKPVTIIGGIQLYSILPFIHPFLEYYTKYPLISDAFWAAATITAAMAGLGYWWGSKRSAKAREQVLNNDVHGSAHWASYEEIQNMALLPPTKAKDVKASKHVCYVGGFKRGTQLTYLQHTGAEHIIAFAPTRSGKGVGLVMPTLLSWADSVVVHDIKGENYLLTAGWRRQMGSRVLKFSPGYAVEKNKDQTEKNQCCHFNPLEEIRVSSPFEVKDVQNIATMVVDPDGKGLNDHWSKTGFALMTSVILHVLYAEHDKTLRGVAAYLNDPELDTVNDAFQKMMNSNHDIDGKYGWRDQHGRPTTIHPVIAQSAREMLNKAEAEQSGVISTMMSFLSLYRDPVVAEWTEYSDFRILDLQDNEDPVSLYLVTSPEDKTRLKPLIRLVLNLIASKFTGDDRLVAQDGRMVCVGKHRLLLLLDEFPSLGKMTIFQDTIAFLAGYNVKLYLITQDKSQLEDGTLGYGKEGALAIINNCHLRLIYAPNEKTTAEWVSSMLGNRTLALENGSQNYQGSVMPTTQGSSVSLTYQSRALLTPDEVLRLRGPIKGGNSIVEAGDMLILVAGFAPVYAQQMLYFKDPVFTARAKIPPPLRSDVLCQGKDYYALLGPHGGILEGKKKAANPEMDADAKKLLDEEEAKELATAQRTADDIVARLPDAAKHPKMPDSVSRAINQHETSDTQKDRRADKAALAAMMQEYPDEPPAEAGSNTADSYGDDSSFS